MCDHEVHPTDYPFLKKLSNNFHKLDDIAIAFLFIHQTTVPYSIKSFRYLQE